ncbi:hypothetical protein K432DRAFT_398149 [Lepidopterella palustris CBS 459.81]|uniref:Uncharacterized protein n=1 Tax=Lepidopterella palustris CBS 459.81 TaxID=1314670 RepID=A0A8E2JA27_9PEZI|nr:hypothetical protein K432DRAFT_398149 [Lepidopterella palustris CBS 459.81]
MKLKRKFKGTIKSSPGTKLHDEYTELSYKISNQREGRRDKLQEEIRGRREREQSVFGIMMALVTVFRKLLTSRISSQGEGHQKAMRTPSFVKNGTQEHRHAGGGMEQDSGSKLEKAAHIDLSHLPPAAFTSTRSSICRSIHEDSNERRPSGIVSLESHHDAL